MALSFWITLVIIDNFRETQPANSIACHIPLGPGFPTTQEPLPLVVVGAPHKGDIFYLLPQNDKVLLGTDGWGKGRKDIAIERDRVTDATLDIILDYSRNEKAIRLNGQELLNAPGQIGSELDRTKIFLGENPINYPGFAPTFPDVAKSAQTRRATCNVKDLE